MSGEDQAGYVGRVTAEGQAAAVTLVRRLGLPAGDPAVLSSRGNLIVHFPAAGTVARVATLTAWQRLRPQLWLAREVAISGYVAGRGGPVVAPAHRADPGPHWQDGFAISLWDHVPPRAVRPSPAEAGAALARLHLTAAAFPGELGDLSPAREHISDGLTVLERESVLDQATIAALRDEHARALAALDEAGADGPPIVLHGDAHPGNLLAAPEAGDPEGKSGGWVWTDLEETSRGPAAWDLAVLTDFYGPGDPRATEALRAYADETGTAIPDEAGFRPFRRARQVEAVVWSLAMAHLYPARYAESAQRMLAALFH